MGRCACGDTRAAPACWRGPFLCKVLGVRSSGSPRPWLYPLLGLALLAAAAWQWRTQADREAAGAGFPPAPSASDVAGAGPLATPAAVAPAALSPADREALLAREARASAAAQPPRTYRGIDGKPRAFAYKDPVAAASEEGMRQARREALMRELAADPAAFARKYRLSLKQVQWIVDGETDFPDELLEP